MESNDWKISSSWFLEPEKRPKPKEKIKTAASIENKAMEILNRIADIQAKPPADGKHFWIMSLEKGDSIPFSEDAFNLLKEGKLFLLKEASWVGENKIQRYGKPLKIANFIDLIEVDEKYIEKT
ncbi:MAG: hypothetical protein K8T10_20970 [Candidatus Eremiobacteraeota bacterium]|nr:hypothetical protein [Candidatus Eremiobacteraeota bacterium]